MSYDLQYFCGLNLTVEQVEELLEADGEGAVQIGKAVILDFINELKSDYPSMEVVPINGGYDLYWSTFSGAITTKEGWLEIPYWVANTFAAEQDQIHSISNRFIKLGMTGYNPQDGEVFGLGFNIKSGFARGAALTEKIVGEQQADSSLKNVLLWVIFIFGALLLLFLVLGIE